jgi:hypothetical protein
VVGRAQADVGHLLAVAAMLDDQVGAPGDGQRPTWVTSGA